MSVHALNCPRMSVLGVFKGSYCTYSFDPKYLDNLTPHHNCPKSLIGPFYYLLTISDVSKT